MDEAGSWGAVSIEAVRRIILLKRFNAPRVYQI
jgi:hypothetical protein